MEWWQKAGIGLKWHLPGCRVGLVNLESCEGVRLQISPRLTRGQSSNTWRGDHEMDTRPERPFGVTTIITEPSLTVPYHRTILLAANTTTSRVCLLLFIFTYDLTSCCHICSRQIFVRLPMRTQCSVFEDSGMFIPFKSCAKNKC